MNLSKTITLLLLLFISSSVFSQRFFKTYEVAPPPGELPYFQPRDLAVKPDQGFLLIGDYRSANQGDEMVAISITPDGDTLWSRSYGSTADEMGVAACPLQQGGWATLGLTFDPGSGASLLLTLLDSAGNITATNSYLDGLIFNSSKNYQMREGPNGDLWVTTEYDKHPANDALVLRIAPNGNLIWARRIEANGYGSGYQLIPTTDGGVIVGGERGTPNFGDSDIFVFKLNAAGNLEWTQSFGAPGIDYFDAINQRANGDLLVLARYRTNGQVRQLGLVCLSENGTFKWKQKYTSPAGDLTGVDVFGYGESILMVGKEFTPVSDEAFVILLDSLGTPLSDAKYREDEFTNRVYTAAPLSDSLVVLSGLYGLGFNVSRGFLWVTDLLPNTVECYTRRVPLTTDSLPINFATGGTIQPITGDSTLTLVSAPAPLRLATHCSDVSECNLEAYFTSNFGANTFLCFGRSLFLENYSVGESRVEWYVNGNLAFQGDQWTYTPTSPGALTITLLAEAGASCSESYSVTFEVAPLPQGNVVINGDNPYCPNDPPTLSISGGPYNLVTWVPSNSNLLNLTVTQPGPYYAFIRDSNFCENETDTVTLTQQSLPALQFSSQANGLSAQFTSGASTATNWNWDFGDGNTSALENPLHTYSTSGAYEVCLSVTYATGCEDTLCQTVQMGATGINPTLENSITVYPNPTSGLLQINSQEADHLEITDLAGKVLLTDQFSPRSEVKTVNLTPLAQGIYLLKVYTPQGVDSRKVLKEK